MKIFLAKLNLFKKPIEVKGAKELIKIITSPPRDWADFTLKFYKKPNKPISYVSHYSVRLTKQNNVLIQWHSIEDEIRILKSAFSDNDFQSIFKNSQFMTYPSKLFFDGYSN